MPRFRPFPVPAANQRPSGDFFFFFFFFFFFLFFFFSLFKQTAAGDCYGRRCYISMMGCQGCGVDFSSSSLYCVWHISINALWSNSTHYYEILNGVLSARHPAFGSREPFHPILSASPWQTTKTTTTKKSPM